MASGMAAIMAKESLAQPLQGVRRHRPVPVQGAPARPVRAADALRRLFGAQGGAERLRRQARGHDRRAALRAGAQRQHARRGRAGRPVPLCRPAAHRSAGPAGKGQRQDGAAADAVVRLPLPGVQHQGGLDGAAGACARRCRRRSARARCWPRASATRASSSPKATTSRRARRSIPTPAPPTTTNATRARPRPRPSRPATRASRCASSPAASTTSTTTWR